MTKIRFDHFITYTSAKNIDDYLKEYAGQGYESQERTVRHDPGLRNGFIFFGPEYIEFCWVEDEVLFAEADSEEKLFRTTPRPFGLGMIADDVQAVHNEWIARGFSLPKVWSKAARDAPPGIPPEWSFQEIPREYLPGVFCFVLTYHSGSTDEVKQVKVPPNTIYAISGVTFVNTEPEVRATSWRNLLAPGEAINQSRSGFHVWIGPHRATWMTPETYQESYGLDWTPFPHPNGELALLHLLAADLNVAKQMIEQNGRRTSPVSVQGENQLLTKPDPRDGFVFVIRQRPIEIWRQERMQRSGERLQLAMD